MAKIGSPGARNPKVAQFSIGLNAVMNARLEALADAAGANKGTMAALCIAAGINILENVYAPRLGVSEETLLGEVHRRSEQLAQDLTR